MRRSIALIALLLPVTAFAQERQRYAPDRVIVRFAEPLSLEESDWGAPAAAAFAAESEVTSVRPLFPETGVAGGHSRQEQARVLRRELGLDATYVLTVPASADIPALAERWAALPNVVYAEPDFGGVAAGAPGYLPPPLSAPAAAITEVPDDPLFPRQYNFHNTGSNSNIPSPTAGADVNAVEAWDITLGSADGLIGILDSGLRLGHPDIAARVWMNPGETLNGSDDDGNGYIDDIRGWDFVNNDNDPTDDNGHGSNVAGTAGAIGNNALGYTGLDRAAQLMILKVFDASLFGFYSWWAPAIMYAADKGARVINLSGGGSDTSAALEAAVDYAHGMGALFTTPMMNFNNDVTYYPAGFVNSFAVGATNQRDERAVPFCWGGGSNWGNHIDLSAPGDYIFNLTHSSDTNYNIFWCGSSMSAPTAAAAASLMLALDPTLTVAELRQIMESTAADQVGRPTEDVAGWDPHHGHGRLDVFAALSAVVTAADDGPAGAASLVLSAPQPNPISTTALLALTTREAGPVMVEVFDTIGRRVATLLDGPVAAGTRTLVLDASSLAAGVYVVRASAPNGAATQRLVVAR